MEEGRCWRNFALKCAAVSCEPEPAFAIGGTPIGGGGPWGFLNPDRPLLKSPGITLLEVKYDHYLPEYIAGLVEMSDRSCSAFSKYACARHYL